METEDKKGKGNEGGIERPFSNAAEPEETKPGKKPKYPPGVWVGSDRNGWKINHKAFD